MEDGAPDKQELAQEEEEQEERRRNRRVPVRFRVTFVGKNMQGSAEARDLSPSGILLVDAQPLLIAGGEVRLRFSLLPNSLPIEVSAQVVRETEDGFALRFTEKNQRVRSLIKLAVDRARRGTG